MAFVSQGLVRVDMFKPENVTAPRLNSPQSSAAHRVEEDPGDVVVSMTEPDDTAAIPEILAIDNSVGKPVTNNTAKLPRKRR